MDTPTACKLVICSLTTSIHLIVTICFSFNFWHSKQSDISATPIRMALLVLLSNILWSISNIFFALDEADGTLSLEFRMPHNILVNIMAASTVGFYTNRLYVSFKNSIYQINNKILIFFVSIAILGIMVVFVPELILVISGGKMHFLPVRQQLFIVSSVAGAMFAFDYISITTIFVYKLFKITLQQRASTFQRTNRMPIGQRSPTDSATRTQDSDVNFEAASKATPSSANISYTITDVNDLGDTQLKLIETITKQSLLIISPFFGIILFTIFMILGSIAPENSIINVSAYFVIGFATIQICIAVWLSFAFATRKYTFCCNRLHVMLKKCCLNLAIRQLNAQRA